MSALLHRAPTPEPSSTVAFIEELFRAAESQSFAVKLWTGAVLQSCRAVRPEFTIVLKHPGALRRMFSTPTERSLGEAYIFDDCDVEGDMEAAVRFGKRLVAEHRSLRARLRLLGLLEALPASAPLLARRAAWLHGTLHSRTRDQAAVRYHYDVSNQFYSLFLDSRMNYSSAHFSRPDEDLDIAQERKLARVCRLLDLHPGERFLDIGCGWGGLIIYAAQNFGIEALGITLSVRQAEWARERIREAGLENRCRVEVRDYRDVTDEGTFEKVASIGMIEHVGTRNLPSYFHAIHRLLARGGALLNSGITRPISEPAHRKGSFVESYVFPDGELETIQELLQMAEESGFELRLAENYRLDYATTLRRWVRRLESRSDEARRVTDDVTYRTWRLYMAGSAARFAAGELYLISALFAPRRPR